MDVGLLLVAAPRRVALTARMVELGFDSLIPDSQNLAPEVWGQLMLAAQATTRIRLGLGVTNSVTRDAAVTASAALSLQGRERRPRPARHRAVGGTTHVDLRT